MPTPSPTEVVAQSGTGTALVSVPDGASSESMVGGDCMVSGPALPGDLEGDVLVDDVEVLIGVDNFVGPLGQPDAERPLVVVVDGEADDATVQLRGGPVAWSWWQGPVASLELVDPVAVDGVMRVRATMTATLERGPRDRRAVRAPQPSPAPGRGGAGPSTTPAPTDSPTARGSDAAALVPIGFAAPPTGDAAPGPMARRVQQARALEVSLELVCTAVP